MTQLCAVKDVFRSQSIDTQSTTKDANQDTGLRNWEIQLVLLDLPEALNLSVQLFAKRFFLLSVGYPVQTVGGALHQSQPTDTTMERVTLHSQKEKGVDQQRRAEFPGPTR